MRISDWSSDVCSSDLTPPLKRRGLFSLRQLHRRHHIPRIAQRSDEAVEMLAVARLAFDVGDQPLCGQRARKSVGSGQSVSVRVDLGGRRIIKKKMNTIHHRSVNNVSNSTDTAT